MCPVSNVCLMWSLTSSVSAGGAARAVRLWVGLGRVRPLGPDGEIHARTELFEMNDETLPDAHTGPSVEPGRACDALGVHAEADFVDGAPVILGEGVAKEGEPEPAVSPGSPYTDDVDPSLAGDLLAEGDARDLNAVYGQKPEGRVEAFPPRDADEPLERAAWPSPHIPEGVLDGLEDRSLVPAGDEGSGGNASGPAWLRRGLVEHALHHVYAAHRRVTEVFQKSSRGLVGPVDVVLDDDARVFGCTGHTVVCPALAPGDQVGAQTQTSKVRAYVAVDRDGHEGTVDHIGVGGDGAVG